MLFRRSMLPQKAIKMSFQETKRGRETDARLLYYTMVYTIVWVRDRHLPALAQSVDRQVLVLQFKDLQRQSAIVTRTLQRLLQKATTLATTTTATTITRAEKKTKCAIHCGFTFIRNVQAQLAGSTILSAPLPNSSNSSDTNLLKAQISYR